MRTVSDYFGSLVFDDRVMRAKLPSRCLCFSEEDH